jgi:uncharacterized membrane protein (UPF0127 family)
LDEALEGGVRDDTFFKRLKGLMFKKSLGEGQGLLISPCYQVHTFFMTIDLDIIFLNKSGLILKLMQCEKPGKISPYTQKSGCVLELPAGTIAKHGLEEYTILTLENRLCHDNLGRAYLGTSNIETHREVGNNYYDGGGIEGLLRRIYRGDYPNNILRAYRKEIIPGHLDYIPQSRVIHSEIFDYEFNHDINTLLHLIEDYSDVCMIDTACRNNLSSKTILEEADLIVVYMSKHCYS